MPTGTALSWQVKRVLVLLLLFLGARQAGMEDGDGVVSSLQGLLLESRSPAGDAEGTRGDTGITRAGRVR